MGLTESSVTTRKSPIFKRTREYFSIRKNNSKIQQSTSVSFSTTSDFGFEDRSRCFSNPENERFNVGCTNNQSAFVGRSRRSSKSSRQNSPGMKEPQLSMHHPQPSVKVHNPQCSVRQLCYVCRNQVRVYIWHIAQGIVASKWHVLSKTVTTPVTLIAAVWLRWIAVEKVKAKRKKLEKRLNLSPWNML
ncbi:hypothetical protein C0J52_01421 [Blattella germanica]|nr:hypothetical protein C0J52_01421 [Blattella germanica]